MKVHVDVTRFATTRRADGPNADPDRLNIRPLNGGKEDDNGNYEAEITGPPHAVRGWLKRNGYSEGSFEVVEE